jgi:hypothetical protein
LKGKKVWAWANMTSAPAIFFKTLVAYVGIDPDKDIEYVLVPNDEALELFKSGKIDAAIKGAGHWPCTGGYERRPAMVPVLLLPHDRGTAVCYKIPNRYQAGTTGTNEG